MQEKKATSIHGSLPSVTLSIIIPVYNTETYVRKCLDSIVSQTYRNWECLLIDDGSKDSSPKICDEYAAKDTRFKVIHKDNGGVSSARNKGLEEACGKWIMFVDSDDTLSSDNSLQDMVADCTGKDFAVYGVRTINEHKEEVKDGSERIDDNIDAKSFVIFLLTGRYGYLGYLHSKLFKRSIININHLRFNEDIFFCEDNLFISQYACCSETKNVHIDNLIKPYKYFRRQGSAMSTIKNNYNPKFFTDFIAYQRIASSFHVAFSDKGINAYAERQISISGQRILNLMKLTNATIPRQKIYILSSLQSNKWYLLDKQSSDIENLKAKAKSLPNKAFSSFLYAWLHSTDCYFSLLSKRWKLLYILSYIIPLSEIHYLAIKLKVI